VVPVSWQAGMKPPEDTEFRAAVVQTLARARQDSTEGISVVETAGGPLRTLDRNRGDMATTHLDHLKSVGVYIMYIYNIYACVCALHFFELRGCFQGVTGRSGMFWLVVR